MQDVVASLEVFLAPMTALLTPGPAMADAKGVPQPNPVLLLLDPLLTDLPFEWLPQLQQATAVVRDFSLHVQHSRATVAAACQVLIPSLHCLFFMSSKSQHHSVGCLCLPTSEQAAHELQTK